MTYAAIVDYAGDERKAWTLARTIRGWRLMDERQFEQAVLAVLLCHAPRVDVEYMGGQRRDTLR
jgi:hypothetical protein